MQFKLYNSFVIGKRFTLSSIPAVGDVVHLGVDDCRHLAARRVSEGEDIELVTSTGVVFFARVLTVKPYSVEITGEAKKADRPPLTIVVAIPQANRAATMVEKCTELGVGAFQPMICERSVAMPKSEGNLIERWKRVAMAAVKQSHAALPLIYPPVSFKNALESYPTGLILHPDSRQSLSELILHYDSLCEFSVFIGPEGGFSPRELALTNELGMKFASLGGNILRIETAAIAATAVFNCIRASNS